MIAGSNQGRRARAGNGPQAQQRLHDVVGWMLFAVVAMAAIPLGSARPFFGMLWALFLGGIATYYGLTLIRRGLPLRSTGVGYFAGALFAMLVLFLIGQILPVPLPESLAPVVTTSGGLALRKSPVSLAPGNTILMLVQMLSYGVLVALTALVAANRYRRLILLDAVFFFIVAHAAYSIAALTQLGDLVLVFPKWAYEGTATGTFVNRNSFATYLAMGMVLGAGLTLDELAYRMQSDRLTRAKDDGRPSRSLTLHVVGLLICGAALLATQSRMGVAVAVVGCVVVAVPISVRIRARGWYRGAFIGAAILAIAALFSAYGVGLLDRLGSVESAADVRGALYAQVLQMIDARPWVGYGGAAFEAAFPIFHHAPVSPDLVWEKAHNTYLALWVELGLVAGCIPILILVHFAVRLAANVFRDEALAAAVALGALAATALHALVDFSLEIEANALLLLFLVGIGIGSLPRFEASKEGRQR